MTIVRDCNPSGSLVSLDSSTIMLRGRCELETLILFSNSGIQTCNLLVSKVFSCFLIPIAHSPVKSIWRTISSCGERSPYHNRYQENAHHYLSLVLQSSQGFHNVAVNVMFMATFKYVNTGVVVEHIIGLFKPVLSLVHLIDCTSVVIARIAHHCPISV